MGSRQVLKEPGPEMLQTARPKRKPQQLFESMELDLWRFAGEHAPIKACILAWLIIAPYEVIRHEIRK